jgi:hypothetical protein
MKYWSQDNDLYLRDNWKVIAKAQFAQVLERSIASIEIRAHHLGIQGRAAPVPT